MLTVGSTYTAAPPTVKALEEPDGVTLICGAAASVSLSVALLLVPMLYSPIVPAFLFVTNRSPPDTAMLCVGPNPEMSEALITAPEVVYSLIVVPLCSRQTDPLPTLRCHTGNWTTAR